MLGTPLLYHTLGGVTTFLLFNNYQKTKKPKQKKQTINTVCNNAKRLCRCSTISYISGYRHICVIVLIYRHFFYFFIYFFKPIHS